MNLLARLAAIGVLSLPLAPSAQPAARGGVKPAPKSDVTVTLPAKCLAVHSPAERDIPAPRVVSTFPVQGATVRPGKLIIRITFDLPMACAGVFSDDPPLKTPLPDGDDQRVVLTYDRRTFRTEGRLEPNSSYGLWLNKGRRRDVMSLAGLPIEPFELTFSSSDGPEIQTTQAALAEDVEAMKGTVDAGPAAGR